MPENGPPGGRIADRGSEVALGELVASAAFFADPPAAYRRLRDEAPVLWCDQLQAWLVSRYRDVVAILKDPVRFSSQARLTKWLEQLPAEVQPRIGDLRRHYESGVVQADPPRHAPMRAALSMAFSPRTVARLRPRIQRFVDDRLDACADAGRLDLVADVAYPLPVTIICELVGVPPEDEGRYREWTHRVYDAIGTGRPRAETILDAQDGVVELEDYFRGLFARRRAAPRDDLLSALLALNDAERAMSEADMLANFGTFVSAGHESTTSLIVNGLHALLAHQQQLARVAADPTLVGSAVEEMLRWVTPFQRDMRLPLVDVDVGGRRIAGGELVWCLLASANRDPEQFPDPEVFDVGRPENHHVAFGMGPHFCLGAALARQEAAVVVETLVRRLEGLRLADERIERPNDYRIRTPRSLWIQFDAVAPRSDS